MCVVRLGGGGVREWRGWRAEREGASQRSVTEEFSNAEASLGQRVDR